MVYKRGLITSEKVVKKILLILLIVIGSSFQLLTVFKSGNQCQLGICFWGPNGHDGVWHLALINQAAKKIPPANPVFAGEVLKNYHWGYNFTAGWLAKILSLSVANVHFRVLPLIFSLLLGWLSFKLGILITGRFWVGFWFAFLNYFASSLGWVITLIRNGNLGGESLFWSMQSASFLLNPPYAMSVILLLLGLCLWKKRQGSLGLARTLFLGLLFGLLLNIKAYLGILFLLALLFSILLDFFVHRRWDKEKVMIGVLSSVAMGVVWFFCQRGGGSPFVFEPLWFVRTMFEAQDRLFIPKLGKVWWILSSSWLTNPKFWILAAGGIFLFIAGNFGTRLLGLLRIRKNSWDWLFLGFIVSGVLIPLFFTQKGTAWNTIQFFYYSLFFSNWFLAKFLDSLTKKKLSNLIGLFFIILPLLLSNHEVFKTYLSPNPTAYIPKNELKALEFLNDQKDGVVLTFPYDPFGKDGITPPLPLYFYETTAYVAGFSGQQTFLEDEMNLEITGYPWKERRVEVEKFFSTTDKILARGLLLNNGIDYVYLANNQDFQIQEGDLGLKMIFDNGPVKIYRVLK